jgi:hypothetical protein
MRSNWVNLCITAAMAFYCVPPAARGQSNTCAYSGINGDCALTLDRQNPIAPPTIYVRHGKKVTVTVTNPLPFEHLSMDLKAAAEQVPVDQFANAFQSITTALGGLEIISGPAPAAAAPGAPRPRHRVHNHFPQLASRAARPMLQVNSGPRCRYMRSQPTSPRISLLGFMHGCAGFALSSIRFPQALLRQTPCQQCVEICPPINRLSRRRRPGPH